MLVTITNGVTLHVQEAGDPKRAPVIFVNSLGTDLRLWDALIPLPPKDLQLIRFDKRGHGLSGCHDDPYTMNDLTSDTEGLIDALGLDPVIFVGPSIGGMIGQKSASRRPDMVRALVLSNAAAKMGDPASWNDRIQSISANGLLSIESSILDRWFGPRYRTTPEAKLWGAMLSRTPEVGYLACCVANRKLRPDRDHARTPPPYARDCRLL